MTSPVVFVGQAPPKSTSPVRAFVDKNCVACHNDRALTAGLSLSGPEIEQVADHAELAEKVLHKIRTGQMPPPGRPRPEGTETKSVVSWLETTLDRAAVAR